MLIFLFASVCFSELPPEYKNYYNALADIEYIFYLDDPTPEDLVEAEGAKKQFTNCTFMVGDPSNYDDEEDYQLNMGVCKILVPKIKAITISTNKDLNTKLGQVSNDASYVWILLVNKPSIAIDLKNLKSKKDVGMDKFNFEFSKTLSVDDLVHSFYKLQMSFIKSRFHASPSNLHKSTKHNQKANKAAKWQDEYVLEISGSMKDKVGFLYLDGHFDVKFVDSDCDCHSLYLRDGTLTSDSKGIVSEIFYIQPYDISGERFDSSKVNVKQFTVYCDYISTTEYVLEYRTDSLYLSYGEGSYYKADIPYGFSTFGFDVEYLYKDITIQIKTGENVPKDKAFPILNLSIVVPLNTNKHLLKSDEEERTPKVTITQNGWEGFNNKPKVVLTYNSADVEVNKESLDNGNFEISKETPPSRPGSQPEPKDGLPPAAIAGIVIGCIVVVAAIVAVVVYFVVFRNKGHDSSKEGEK